jgi:hypothetical protein
MVGFVRREYVVAAGESSVHYYCGRCHSVWRVNDERNIVNKVILDQRSTDRRSLDAKNRI